MPITGIGTVVAYSIAGEITTESQGLHRPWKGIFNAAAAPKFFHRLTSTSSIISKSKMMLWQNVR
jgi:hypothetical protein